MIFVCFVIILFLLTLLIVQKKTIMRLRKRIQILQSECEFANALRKRDQKSIGFVVSCKENSSGVNYLAIGNSITVHSKCEYWFTESGMAASRIEYDYVHIVAENLKKKGKQINFLAYNFYIWEAQKNDRTEALEILDSYLCPELNIITIQLGENVIEFDTLENDLTQLVKHIKGKSPMAAIVIIGDFWKVEEREKIKERVCRNTKSFFISLDDISDKKEYKCGTNAVIYDEEGNEHIVEHSGVARHPNDRAMKYIADRIMGHIESEI